MDVLDRKDDVGESAKNGSFGGFVSMFVVGMKYG
jgi:hypothetical protein